MATKASAKTIDLNCPGCSALLELDRGFAGGVCRCSTCGTLMTVPKLSSEKPETLVRAERPGEKPGTPSRPSRPQRPEAPPKKTSLTRNARPTSVPREETPAVPEVEEEHVYRTASGREVRVDESRVPMAESKRRAIRAATVAVFVAVVGGVLALCGLATYMLVTQPTAEEIAAANYVETFSYDELANPYAIEAPNLLGLPLANRVALVLDPSGMSSETWATVRGALLDGVGRDQRNVFLTVVVLDAEGVSMPLNQAPLSPDRPAELASVLEAIDPAEVTAALGDGVDSALRVEPEVLIVATGRSLKSDEASAIEASIPEEGVRFDALLIDADSFALEDAARRTNGHYATLDAGFDLETWQPVE
ncbi:MAG: hypothetical protein AAGF84_09900 [Planctomycetota bacterium]